MMTSDEMLELVRKDRPNENILRIISFWEVTKGNYRVQVDYGDYHDTITYPKLKPGTNVLNLPHYD